MQFLRRTDPRVLIIPIIGSATLMFLWSVWPGSGRPLAAQGPPGPAAMADNRWPADPRILIIRGDQPGEYAYPHGRTPPPPDPDNHLRRLPDVSGSTTSLDPAFSQSIPPAGAAGNGLRGSPAVRDFQPQPLPVPGAASAHSLGTDNPSPTTTNPSIAGPSLVPQNTPRETIIIRESAPAAEPAREGWVQLGFEHALGILVGLILCLLLLLSIFLILMRRLVDKSTLRAELSTIYGLISRPVVVSGEAAGPVLRSRAGGAVRPAAKATSAKPAARVAKTPELPKRNTKVVQYTDLSIEYDDLRETFDQERKELEQEIKKEEAAIMERIIAENASMSAKMVGLSAA